MARALLKQNNTVMHRQHKASSTQDGAALKVAYRNCAHDTPADAKNLRGRSQSRIERWDRLRRTWHQKNDPSRDESGEGVRNLVEDISQLVTKPPLEVYVDGKDMLVENWAQSEGSAISLSCNAKESPHSSKKFNSLRLVPRVSFCICFRALALPANVVKMLLGVDSSNDPEEVGDASVCRRSYMW
ncbi:hypothetical protein BD779DRAFT_1472383 [Infundibulicybe gibba]|nr:hypothetical protein BD779DRAFT_1472383 [Infundibulicybe gibba]